MERVFAGGQFAKAVVAFGILGLIGSVQGADLSLPVTGELLGTVVNSAGTPQMGASVQIFNKYQRVVARSLTDSAGRFAFSGLAADLYSVRVSLASFLPASRDQIIIKAGLDSVLEIHLATLLSSIEISYTVPAGAMSDDWKWVLRSSPATRPVTRLLPVDFPETQPKVHPHVFSETHAVVSVSGGDGGLLDSDVMGPDLGTAFAVSTNVFGKNQVQVAGTLGENAEFGPAAMALCAIYSRTDDGPLGAPPEVTFTVTQLGGVSQFGGGAANAGMAGALPMLRSMSLGIYEVADPLDNLHVEYGAVGETVDYVQHANRLSPFARVTVDLGSAGSLIATYSDGGRPDELLEHQQYREAQSDGQSGDLSEPLETLSRLPQLSNSNGQLALQRTQNYELGYAKTSGADTYSVSAFHENVWNGRLNVAGDLSSLDSGDLFSDGISPLSTYNIGNYNRLGYIASVNQRVTDSLDVALAYGRMDGFAANPNGIANGTINPSARFLSEKQSNIATISTRMVVPRFGTRISANYGWIDAQMAIPPHMFTTQDAVTLPGFNVLVRQPLPSFFGIPGRLELTADLRNLLADGYTPINNGCGGNFLVVEAPRAIRGGLKFTF
ncbi:MAG: TonB-dependent receptor [Acidobacteriota bacterium]|nr:TonB-dependent receptor [Acidobacteriota bacterium]